MTVQLPVYNELNVVERVIDAAAALDYPPDRLHIQVLDDSTDESVALAAARVAQHQAQGLRISHVRRPSRQGYKAGALRHGLDETDGEFIAIFDADFVPDPDFLRRTLPYFDSPEVGVVQTRWGHLNETDSLLTRLQAFALNAHFLVEQSGRSQGGHFINFNGTGGVWRRTCIADAGGWHTDTLTEDLDLSYRAQLRNWQFVYLPQVVTPAELPEQMDALKSQQYRWTKGAAETARKHLGRVLRDPQVPAATKRHAVFHLLNSTVFVAILLMTLLSVPLVVLQSVARLRPAFQFASVFMLGFAPLMVYYHASWRWSGGRRGAPLGFVAQFLLFLSVSMGLALHNTGAVLSGLAGQASEFVRTPKLGRGIRGRIRRRYRTGGLGWLTLCEALLCLYALGGIGLALRTGNYGLVPFHALVATGYGAIVWYSVLHARRA
ncbi:cellulose synthase family protein [Hymenobacter busanensis]|uniref:cellulose synthase family protein n=1 Tax=Hymenobacter busanensis TaxID=2607656 RepID=UPI001F2EA204|nr:cellulose synthase family protein [Hymenobacter busanensis]